MNAMWNDYDDEWDDDEPSLVRRERRPAGRRRRVTVLSLTAAALIAGSWVTVAGVTAAAGTGMTPSAAPTPSAAAKQDPSVSAQLRNRIVELKSLEATAVRQGDFQQAQGLDAEIGRLSRELRGAPVAPVSRMGSAVAPAPITPPISSGGVFSDSRDTAFELQLFA